MLLSEHQLHLIYCKNVINEGLMAMFPILTLDRSKIPGNVAIYKEMLSFGEENMKN